MNLTVEQPVSPRPPGDDDFAYWVVQEANPLLVDLRTFANTRQQIRVTAQTVLSAAPLVIWASEDMPVHAAWDVELVVLGIATDDSTGGYRRIGRFKRGAGAPALVGGVSLPVPDSEDVGGWDVTLAIVSNTIQASVTGDVGRTINWAAVVILSEVKG